MIFVGDIALPYKNAVSLKSIPSSFFTKKWFGNLEGALIDNKDNINKEKHVYNDKNAIRKLCSQFDFIGFALANNHILDIGSFEESSSFLHDIEVPFCGIGSTLQLASEPLIIYESGNQIVIVNFGWEVIQCEITLGNYIGVNPIRKGHVIETVKRHINNYPDAFIIPFMHWNYELEGEPQPFERELAKELIDLGVCGIIGAHPHRVGGFEVYNGKPIVYSLGNWMFKQNYYWNSKLKFPSFCDLELALEWDFDKNELQFHFFYYDKINSLLTYSHSENSCSETMKKLTPFRGLSNEKYKKWYKKNHYHKNKGLPIYYWDDSNLKVNVKNKLNKVRDIMIRLITVFR